MLVGIGPVYRPTSNCAFWMNQCWERLEIGTTSRLFTMARSASAHWEQASGSGIVIALAAALSYAVFLIPEKLLPAGEIGPDRNATIWLGRLKLKPPM